MAGKAEPLVEGDHALIGRIVPGFDVWFVMLLCVDNGAQFEGKRDALTAIGAFHAGQVTDAFCLNMPYPAANVKGRRQNIFLNFWILPIF